MAVVNFCGASGRSHNFERVAPGSEWAGEEGIVLFAARGTFGWRVIKIAELDGRPDNVQPIWAWREAERFGARAVFLQKTQRILDRKTTIADLEDGLSPVCESFPRLQRVA